MAGFVYIMSNPLFTRIKIGMSSKDPTKDRLKQLNSETGTAEKYQCEYYAFVDDEKGLEQAVHKNLAESRVHKEFFEVSILEAINAIKNLADNYGGIKYEEKYYKNICKEKFENFTYEGEFKLFRFHGFGTLKYHDGSDEYIGNWKNGKRHGKGESKKTDGISYNGDWIEDKWHGKGQAIFPNGSIYTGDWVEGKFHGNGERIAANGHTDTGEWIKNRLHGKCVQKFSNGATFEGNFKNGVAHGEGVMWGANGDRFEQKYEDGKKISSKHTNDNTIFKLIMWGLGIFAVLAFFDAL